METTTKTVWIQGYAVPVNTARAPGDFIHPFERAGLDRPPYKFVRHYVSKYQACQGAPIQPGTSCDYCGTGIMDVYLLKGAGGREFKVGCDCVFKACRKGDRILSDVEKAKKTLDRDKRHAREQVKAAEAETFLARDDVRAFMASRPSWSPWRAKQGDTLANYADYVWRVAGVTGKIKLARDVRKAMEAAPVASAEGAP